MSRMLMASSQDQFPAGHPTLTLLGGGGVISQVLGNKKFTLPPEQTVAFFIKKYSK